MENFALVSDVAKDSPVTEGVKYAGSKKRMLPYILDLVSDVSPNTILDAFCGTSRVSQAFANSGYSVVANDISAWSEVFATCYLLSDSPASEYRALISHLNNVRPVDGWFTENYGGDAQTNCSLGADGLKKPWQRHNTRRLDGIRDEIDRLDLSHVERCIALTSLMRALDSVDNTLGHFASYLSQWSARSYKELRLTVPKISKRHRENFVYRKDIFALLPDVEVDLAYFDPPYGSNNEKMPPSRVRYSAYYHVWTSICLNDRPVLFGKAKRRADTSDNYCPSVFEDFRRNSNGQLIAVNAIRKLFEEVRAKHVVLSYSSGGRATAEELNSVMSDNGKVLRVMEVDYKRNVMADMRWTNDWIREAEMPHKEFLFLVAKR